MASHIDNERLCFIVEWYEEIAARIRQFQFFYFVEAKHVEMYDIKNHRLFLRTAVKEQYLKASDLYIGNSISVCSRLLKIVDYGDQYTRNKLASQTEKTLGLIKPEAFDKLGQILDIIYQKGFLITRLRSCKMERKHAMELYHEHVSKPYLKVLLECILSGPIAVFEIVGNNVLNGWKEVLGPANPDEARTQAPNSIRAQYGSDVIYNGAHGSSSAEAAAQEIELFFSKQGPRPLNTATVKNCTLCIVKPSVFKAGLTGKILMAISESGFTIGAAQIFTLEKANAEEFLEVYKGVVNEYPAMITELISGPCMALEITGPENGPPVGPAFRELCGPADPEIARHLRPRSLRAVFGTDKIKNAVHCTDLTEDGQLEVEYFFRILDR